MSALPRVARLAGAAIGLAAVGAAAGSLVERRVAGRLSAPRAERSEPLGSVRGKPVTVTTPDGVDLHVEVDEVDGEGTTPAVTVVLVHGYALNLDCWQPQRLTLRGAPGGAGRDARRLVLYDQRSHGRSGRGSRDSATIEQLGRDLRQVLDEVVPDGPVALLGHSMGGMTIMALAEQAPDYVAERVSAVGLLSTSAGDLGRVRLGLPGPLGGVARRLVPGTLAVAARAPRLVETGRRAGSDLGYLLTQRYAFGGEVDAELVQFVDRMLSATPVSVIAEFFPDFAMHDRYEALSALRGVPTLVLCGDRDLVTPVEHSRLIAERLPAAVLCELEGAGHLVNLERPGEVNRALRSLLERSEGRTTS